jgi:hypothetical protein
VANPVPPGYGIGNQVFMLAAVVAYALEFDRCVVLPSTFFHPGSRNSRSYRDTVFRHFWLQPQLWDAMEGSVKVFDYDGAYTWQPGLSMHYGPFEEPAIVLRGGAKDFWMVVLRGGYQHYNYTWAHRALLASFLRPSPSDTRALLRKYERELKLLRAQLDPAALIARPSSARSATPARVAAPPPLRHARWAARAAGARRSARCAAQALTPFPHVRSQPLAPLQPPIQTMPSLHSKPSTGLH